MPAATAYVKILSEAFAFSLFLWPISLVVVAAAVLGLKGGSSQYGPRFLSRVGPFLFTYVTPAIVALLGTKLRFDHVSHPTWVAPPNWYGALLWGVVAAHAVALVAAGFVLKECYVRAVLVLLPGLWFSICCGGIAAMAIAGVGT